MPCGAARLRTQERLAQAAQLKRPYMIGGVTIFDKQEQKGLPCGFRSVGVSVFDYRLRKAVRWLPFTLLQVVEALAVGLQHLLGLSGPHGITLLQEASAALLALASLSEAPAAPTATALPGTSPPTATFTFTGGALAPTCTLVVGAAGNSAGATKAVASPASGAGAVSAVSRAPDFVRMQRIVRVGPLDGRAAGAGGRGGDRQVSTCGYCGG